MQIVIHTESRSIEYYYRCLLPFPSLSSLSACSRLNDTELAKARVDVLVDRTKISLLFSSSPLRLSFLFHASILSNLQYLFKIEKRSICFQSFNFDFWQVFLACLWIKLVLIMYLKLLSLFSLYIQKINIKNKLINR